MHSSATRRVLAAAVAFCLAVSGCGGDGGGPTDPDPSTPASIAIAAGDGQQAAAGAAVPVAPSVVVRDADGDPVAGVSVTFAVASGGGDLTGATPTTNASGVAAVSSWSLGPSGPQRITARAGTLAPVEFQATITPGTEQIVGTIGAGGGTFELDLPGSHLDGLKLTAPAGMYPGTTQWRMSTGTLSPKFSAPAGFTVMGPPLIVQTAAVRGQKLMTLEVPVDADEDDLVFIALHDPVSGASELLTTVERKDGAVVVATGHLRGDLLPGASPLGTIRTASLSNDVASQVVRVTLDKLDGIQAAINRWPVIDHGTGAHPEGVAAGISAINSMASSGGAPNLGSAIKGLSIAGFYAEAGALAVAHQAQEVMSPEITKAFANLQPMFDKLAKEQRDRLVMENTLAMIRFMSRPAILGFMYESLGKPGAVTVTSGSASHLSVVHPAKLDPTPVTLNAGGFGSFTLPLTANSDQHPVDRMLPISSTIAELDEIKRLLGDIGRLSQASSDAFRDQVNRELAIAAGLPELSAQIRNNFQQSWVQTPLGGIVVRRQSAELRVLGQKFTVHLPDGTEAARSTGDPISVVTDAQVTAPNGVAVQRTISAFVEDASGGVRQVSVATARMAYAPFEISPGTIEIEEGEQDVDFSASVAAPPTNGYIVQWMWGDGDSTEVVNDTQASHEYDAPDNYTVVATLMASGTREHLAVDTARVLGGASAWVGRATVVGVYTGSNNAHTEYGEATNVRFELGPDDGTGTDRYRVVSGQIRMWNEAPCASYVSPTVLVDLGTVPNPQWLNTRTTNPEQGGTPSTGLWYQGNAYAPGALRTRPCPTDFNPNPADYAYIGGLVWLNTYDTDLPDTIWRAAPDENVIEGSLTRQIGTTLTYTWSWRFDRVSD